MGEVVSVSMLVVVLGFAVIRPRGLPEAVAAVPAALIVLLTGALGWDKADRDLMAEKPRNPKYHILNKGNIADLLMCGIIIGGLAFINYLWFFGRNGVVEANVESGSIIHMKATALTYLTIVLCQLGNIMQRRSQQGLFTRYQFHNKQLWIAMALSLFCIINVIYNPWIAPYFGASSLSLVDWGYALGATIIFLTIRELERIYGLRHAHIA